jgi:hypothetical protein
MWAIEKRTSQLKDRDPARAYNRMAGASRPAPAIPFKTGMPLGLVGDAKS